ncbi:uncharacterized protein LOC130802612 [Amaranthus tricolor]|uniref:uncharacterized protein LOC130802612 n=1 Tax=Amaranthus tricolor TaxID=29722 RepID=UPI0025844A7F|nr:uncharacterized protein LOC130802612 [Amaranthus tricolor]
MENENPTDHNNLLIDKCMTHKYNNITSNQLMLIAFPFSLAGAAKQWLQEEEPNSIATWEALKKAFLHRYYPPGKTSKYRNEISTFKKKDGESLYDAWERFKSLIRRCPHHGLPDWMVIETVYNALSHEIHTSVDAAAGGNFIMKTLTQAKKILDDMASNYHWREQSTPRRGGRYEVDAIVALTNNVQALTRKVEQMDVAAVNKVCGACGLNGHFSVDCQLQAEGVAALEQVKAIQNQNARQQYNPYSNTFNPRWRDHPNFSYKNNNAQNPSSSYNIPLGFQQRPPFPPQQQHPPKSNLESLMENFMATQSKQNEHFSTSINQILAHNKMIDTQMAQMAQQLSNLSMQKGQLPGNTEKNPTTSPHQQLNAVTTRTGRTPHVLAPKVKTSPIVVQDSGANDDVSKEKKDELVNSDKPTIAGRTYTPPVSFPSRLAQAKLEHKYGKLLQVLSKLQINIPFLEAIKEMPSYAKFLKDIISNKRKLAESVVETLNGQCSAILECKIPKKQADPGSLLSR